MSIKAGFLSSLSNILNYSSIDSFSLYKGKSGEITLSLSGLVDTKNNNQPPSKLNIEGIELQLVNFSQISSTRWSLTYSNNNTEPIFILSLDRNITYLSFHSVEYTFLLGTENSLMWKNFTKQLVRDAGSKTILKYRVTNSVYFEADVWDLYTIINDITAYLPFNIILSNIQNYPIKDFKVQVGMNLISILKTLIPHPYFTIRRLPNTNTYIVEPLDDTKTANTSNLFNIDCTRLVSESTLADFNGYSIVVIGGLGKPTDSQLPDKLPILSSFNKSISGNKPVTRRLIDIFS